MTSPFDIVGRTTITELCLGLAFLRGAMVPRASREIEGWFEAPVSSAQVDQTVTRMIERGWLVPHPMKTGGYVLTEVGEDVVEQAFKGFIRFIDAGEHRWEVGMMFQIAKVHYDRRKN